MSSTMIHEREPLDRIMRMIQEVLDDVTLAREAEESVERMIGDGLQRVESDRPDEARSLEAQDNFRAFAHALKQYAIENRLTTVEVSDLASVLRRLCPLYPIC